MKVESATTLGELLRAMLPGASGRTRKQALEAGRVRVNGAVVRLPKTTLRRGDVVELGRRRPPREAPRLPSELRILHEDADVLVVEKGAGLLTISTARERERTVYAHLTSHVRAEDPRARVFVCHRLDQLASGVLVFARSARAKLALKRQFRAHTVDRVYAVVVEGRLEGKGVVRKRLVEMASLRVRETATGGAEAVTRFRALVSGDRYSTLEVRLETGKKHQIRVHLAGRGHPVVGDPVYGTGPGPIGRLALHARRLGFDHPRTRERLVFESPVPPAFRKLRR